MLYKPDCDSNDCELPNEKATPSIFSYRDVAYEVACGWAINRIPCILLEPIALDWVVDRLTVGLKNRSRFILDN